MPSLPKILASLCRSPWLYGSWLATFGSAICSHINSGYRGTPLLGAASILLTITAIALFYVQLNRVRGELALPQTRSTLGLFLSVYNLHLRALLLSAPLLGLFFGLGTFDAITKAYFGLGSKADFIRLAWPWALAYFGFLALDQAGRVAVVANGTARRSLRQGLRVARALPGPLAAFMGVELALFCVNMSDFLLPPDSGPSWLTPALTIGVAPFYFLLQVGGTAYLAKRFLGSGGHYQA